MAKRKKKVEEQLDDREEAFLMVIDQLNRLNDAQMQALARAAGCHWGTLYSWRSGITRGPRISTLFPVARALGYHIRLMGTGRKRPALTAVK